MTIAEGLQPDQQPARWDDHVVLYEEVFEPLSLAFARQAIARLELRDGERVLDVAAGTGGAALAMAETARALPRSMARPAWSSGSQRARSARLAIDAR